MSYTQRFRPVTRSATASGKCPVCGKRTTRKATFMQTVNPFNRNADGAVKTESEIGAELRAEAKAWAPDFRHEACKEGHTP